MPINFSTTPVVVPGLYDNAEAVPAFQKWSGQMAIS